MFGQINFFFFYLINEFKNELFMHLSQLSIDV